MDEDLRCEEIVAELQKSFVPFFIIPDLARAKRCERPWRDLLGDHVLCLESSVDVCFVTAGAILLSEGRASSIDELARLLSHAGLPSERKSQAVRSLGPFAEVVLNSSGYTTRDNNWLSQITDRIRGAKS